MARLRVRIELNRGGVGVPLRKLAGVTSEAHRFFRMVGEDVGIDAERGDWVASDFDNRSLSFTAEFVGAVNPEQASGFCAAFDGVTLLRRSTIAQFARIAEAIGEDEVIGFGLFEKDAATEPTEWRSLAKRDALKISSEIRSLLETMGDAESPLPAPLDPEVSTGVFGGSSERLRQSVIVERLSRLEGDVNRHNAELADLRQKSSGAEQSMQHLLTAVEEFCDRASKQFARMSPAQLTEAKRSWWKSGYLWASAAVAVAAVGLLYFGGRRTPQPPPSPRVEAAAPPVPAPVAQKPAAAAQPAPSPAIPTPAPRKGAEPAAKSTVHQVELKATEASWVSVTVGGKAVVERVLQPGETRTVEAAEAVRIKVGNAGGIEIKRDGQPLPPLGPSGRVRIIDLK